MHVIRHQVMGVNITARSLCSRLQAIEIEAVVIILDEAGLTVIAALDDMLGDVDEIEAREAGHTQGFLLFFWASIGKRVRRILEVKREAVCHLYDQKIVSDPFFSCFY